MTVPTFEIVSVEPRIELDDAERQYCEHSWTQLEIHPLFCRRYSCTPEWKLEPRKLSHAYFTYWESGCAELTLGARRFRLQGGELILFGGDEPHAITPIGRSPCRMCNLHFKALLDGAFDLPRQWNLGGVYSCRELIRPETFLAIPAILQCKEPGGTAFVTALIRTVLYQISVQHSRPPKQRTPTRMEPVFDLIKRKFADPDLDPARLARVLGISKVYCRQLFRRHCGQSPLQYLRTVRLEHAGLLLQTTDLAVKEIAGQCGFSDLNFFHRVFKRATGDSPGDFRNKMRERADRQF